MAQQHCVTRLNVGLFTGNNGIANGEPLRRNDVGQFAIFVLYKRDERRTVGIILEPFDGGRDVPGATLEIDDTIELLVTAGDAARDRSSIAAARSVPNSSFRAT